jgi:hypothetical protein
VTTFSTTCGVIWLYSRVIRVCNFFEISTGIFKMVLPRHPNETNLMQSDRLIWAAINSWRLFDLHKILPDNRLISCMIFFFLSRIWRYWNENFCTCFSKIFGYKVINNVFIKRMINGFVSTIRNSHEQTIIMWIKVNFLNCALISRSIY